MVHRRSVRVVRLLPLVALSALLLGGCDRPRAMTVDEIKEKYALMLLEGASQRYTMIRAERAEPGSFDLFDVRVEDGQRVLHAKRAEIIVDAHGGTVSLKLYDVVGASTDGGEIIALPSLQTEKIRLRRQIVQR